MQLFFPTWFFLCVSIIYAATNVTKIHNANENKTIKVTGNDTASKNISLTEINKSTNDKLITPENGRNTSQHLSHSQNNATSNATEKSHTRDSTGDDRFSAGLTQQIFFEIDGYEISDLLNSPKFPEKPDAVNIINNIDHTEVDGNGRTKDSEDHLQKFGVRIFGYFKPPQDGKYIFKISSKAASKFLLSHTENPTELNVYAEVKGRQLVNPNDYAKFLKQVSMPIELKANEMYYFEVLHKVLNSPNHVQLGAIFPDGSDHSPLEGSYFFSMKDLSVIGGSSSMNIGSDNAGIAAGNGIIMDKSDWSEKHEEAGNEVGFSKPSVDALKAAYEAGLKAGQQNGQDAGASAGESAGKQAGGDAGAKAGAEAGLKAAAEALGISIDQLKKGKDERYANVNCALKIRIYAANFKCKRPRGHICKYALNTEEDNTVRLSPPEAATTFIVHKPGLNHELSSVSFELDDKRGMYLINDGLKVIAAPLDDTPQFALHASFDVDSQDSIVQSTYGIKLRDSPDSYVCHTVGTTDVNVDRFSDNCVFHFIPIEFDMNSIKQSCTDFCNKDEELGTASPTNEMNLDMITSTPKITPINESSSNVLLNSFANHAVKIASEKLDERENQKLKSKVDTDNKLLNGQTYYEISHSDGVKDVKGAMNTNNGIHGNEDEKSRIHFLKVKFENHIPNPLYGAAEVKSNLQNTPYSVANGAQITVTKSVVGRVPVTFTAEDSDNDSISLRLNGSSQMTVYPSANVPIKPILVVITRSSESYNEFHPESTADLSTDEHLTPIKHFPPKEHALDYALDHPILHHDVTNEHTAVHHAKDLSSFNRPFTPVLQNNQPSILNPVQITPPVNYLSNVARHQTGYQKDMLPDIVEISYDDVNNRKKTITEIHMSKPKSVYSSSQNKTYSPFPKNDALTSSDALKRQKNMTVRAHRKSLLLPDDAEIYMIKSVTSQPFEFTNDEVDSTSFPKKKTSDIGHVRSDVENRNSTKNMTELSNSHEIDDELPSTLKESRDFKNESASEEIAINNLVQTYRNLSLNIGDGLQDDGGVNDDTETPTKASTESTPTVETASTSNDIDNENSLFDPIEISKKNSSEEKEQTSLKSVEDKFISQTGNNTSNDILLYTKTERRNNSNIPLETGDEIFNMFKENEGVSEKGKNVAIETFFNSKKNSGEQKLEADPRKENSTNIVEVESVAERKTVMPTQQKEVSQFISKENPSFSDHETANSVSQNSLIEKKRLIKTIKMLEENMYRAKLKTLGNFLKEYTSTDSKQSKRYAVWLAQHNHPNSWYYGVPVTGLKRSPIPHHKNYKKQSARMKIVHEDDDIPLSKSFITQPFYANQYRGLPLHDEKRYEIPSDNERNNLNAMKYLRTKLKRQYLARKAKLLKDYIAQKKYQIAPTFDHSKFTNPKAKWLARQNYISYVKRNRIAKINWLKKNYCKCPLKCFASKYKTKCIRGCELHCLKKFAHKIRKRDTKIGDDLSRKDIDSHGHNSESSEEIHTRTRRSTETKSRRKVETSIKFINKNRNRDKSRKNKSKQPKNFHSRSDAGKKSNIADISKMPKTYALKLFDIQKVELPVSLVSPRFAKQYIPARKIEENTTRKNAIWKHVPHHESYKEIFKKSQALAKHRMTSSQRSDRHFSKYTTSRKSKTAFLSPYATKRIYSGMVFKHLLPHNLSKQKRIYNSKQRPLFMRKQRPSNSFKLLPIIVSSKQANINPANQATLFLRKPRPRYPIKQGPIYPKPHEFWKYYLNLPSYYQSSNKTQIRNSYHINSSNIKKLGTNIKKLGTNFYGKWNSYKKPWQPNIYTASNSMYNINSWFRLMKAKREYQKALAKSRLDWLKYWKKGFPMTNLSNKNIKYNTLNKKSMSLKSNMQLKDKNKAQNQFSAIAKFLIPYKPLRNLFPPLGIPRKKKLLEEKVPKSSIPQNPSRPAIPFAPAIRDSRWLRNRYQSNNNNPYLNYWYANSMPVMFYRNPFSYPGFMSQSFASVLKAKYMYDRALNNYVLLTKYHNSPKDSAKYQAFLRNYKQRPNSNRGNVPFPVNTNNANRLTALKNIKAKQSVALVTPKKVMPARRIVPKVKIITDSDNELPRKYITVTGDRRSIGHQNINKTLKNKIIGKILLDKENYITNTSVNCNNTNFENNTLCLENATESFSTKNISSQLNKTDNSNQLTPTSISDEINAISFLRDEDAEYNATAPANNDQISKNSTLRERNSPYVIRKIILNGNNAPLNKAPLKFGNTKKSGRKDNDTLTKFKKRNGASNDIRKLFFPPHETLQIVKQVDAKLSSSRTREKRLKNHTISVTKEYNDLIKHLVTGQNITDLIRKNSTESRNIITDEQNADRRKATHDIKRQDKWERKKLEARLKKFRDSNQYKLALAMLSKSGIPFYVHKHQPFREYMGFRGIHPINKTDFPMKRNTTLVDLKEEFEKFINHEEDKGTGSQLVSSNQNQDNTTKNEESLESKANVSKDDLNTETHDYNQNNVSFQKVPIENTTKQELKNESSSENKPIQLPLHQTKTSDDDKKKTNPLEEVKLEIEKEENHRENNEKENEQKERVNTEVSILKKIKALAFAHKKQNPNKSVALNKPPEKKLEKTPLSDKGKLTDKKFKEQNQRVPFQNNHSLKNGTGNDSGKIRLGGNSVETISIPHEIEALYSDRIDSTNPDFELAANKNENFNFGESKGVNNHDSMYGDWFDAGFKPDVITKQDLRMSKSKYMSRVLAKQKEMKNKKVSDDAKYLFYGPTVKQVEDKIDYIVKNEETDEQRELQNLIKESIGSPNMDEIGQLAVSKEESKDIAEKGDDELKTGVNLTKNNDYDDKAALDFDSTYLDKPSHKQRQIANDPDVFLENEVIKSKGDNNDIEKILSDYKDELSLNDDANEGFFDNPREKGDVLKQVNEQNKKELENIRHDLGRAFTSRGNSRTHLLSLTRNNYSDFNVEELAAKKKTVNDLKNKAENSIYSAMMNLTKDTMNVRSALDNQIKEFAENSGKVLLKQIEDPNVPTSKLFRKHELQDQNNEGMEQIKAKWKKIRAKKFDESDDSDQPNNGDLLSRYFHEIETNDDINKTRQRKSRQEKRQKKIKATLKMINDLEKQIDKMIKESEGRGDDKTTRKLKKLKRKGKAAIFHELITGKLKHKDDEDKLDKSNVTDASYTSALENNEDNNDENDETEVGIPESIEALNPNDISEHFNNINKRIQTQDTDATDDENDIKPPDKNIQILDELPAKTRVPYNTHASGDIPKTKQLNLIHDIASKDRKVSLEQAEALMHIQKQEVNQDLQQLKEITQEGLQSTFAKAVAKQQRFMDAIQGEDSDVAETRDQLSSQPSSQESTEQTPSDNEKLISAIQYAKPAYMQTDPVVKQFIQLRPDDLSNTYPNGKNRIHGVINPVMSNRHVDDSDDDLVDPDTNSTQDGESEEDDGEESNEYEEND